ncbi:Sialidase [Xylariaceae sp. FL0255]|nr:Sialidase [Xylariaceae sp. FL0255]
MCHAHSSLQRRYYRRLLRLLIILATIGVIMHKLLDHFHKKHGDAPAPQQYPGQQDPRAQAPLQHQQQQGYPSQAPAHPSPQHGPRPHTWTLSSDVKPLAEGGTYPRLCRLSDGSFLCVLTRVVNGEHRLVVTRSTDNGRTFQLHGEITRGRGDIDNGFLLEVAAPGRPPTILAAFRNHAKDPNSGAVTHFRITVCKSEDGGRTWKFASQAAQQSAQASSGMGLWEPFMRISGSAPHPNTGMPVVQLTYSGELAKINQETFRVDSFDGGMTWSSPPRCLRCHAHSENLRDGMQGIAPTVDASTGRPALVMVFETTRRKPNFSLEYVVSYDDGETWGDRGVVYVPRGQGRNAGSPQIAACKGGRLAVVFMCDEDVAEKQWPRNAAVKAVFADELVNGRIAWSQNPVLVHEAPSHWPGVLCTAEDEVMAVFEHRGKPLGRLIRVSD